MRVPMSWLRDYVEVPDGTNGRHVADRLVQAGLEVETVEQLGADLSGPLVVGRVLQFSEEEHSNGKTIRWCRVGVGDAHNEPAVDAIPAGRSVVCGARNFAVDDLVVVCLPGAVLPGGFAISARRTYGHVSDGMICSARELALGDDHTGIIVLPPGSAQVGDDAIELLGLVDEVLDIAVTADRGYALSMRGVAREVAIAFGLTLRDPAQVELAKADGPDWPVDVVDPSGCDRFVARSVTGFDKTAPSPLWLQRRVQLCGVRPISLAVDVTNYVMLELGQPLHAYDRSRLRGPIVVRRADVDESVTTLDGVVRTLSVEDLLITDESGPIGIAGVMGGSTTEISADTQDIVIEAAHFDPVTIARSARRHRLPSEASRRFERGVDDRLQEAAAQRAVGLLAKLGSAHIEPTATVVGVAAPRTSVPMPLDLPARIVGYPYESDDVLASLSAVGCEVAVDTGVVHATPPSWRPDLTQPVDLVEEVARLRGYDVIPSVLPAAAAGLGLTQAQRLRRRVGIALSGAGYVEVLSYPFVNPEVFEAFGLAPDDPRRHALRLANPLSDEEPLLRTSLLPGLLATLRRNVGRGADDVALFEIGLVFRPEPGAATKAERPGVEARPSDAELAALDEALPRQPRRVATALAGRREASGWWGEGRAVHWADAVESARVVARAAGVELTVVKDEHAPWHPGRCAALVVSSETGERIVGHAGELHPRVVGALGLPERSAAMELDLDAMTQDDGTRVVPAPLVATFPVAKEDVALVVADSVSVAEVSAALRAGAGPLLESVRLFDVYTGAQIPPGHRSLAFALRFRASDRTLTDDEVAAARDAAVLAATRATGALQRT
jgi:phenylalanyl-tRNA synthetase beta chain